MIADNYPWEQGRNDVRAAKQSILESLEANKGYIAFEAERAALAEIVDLPELDDPFACIEVTTVFARLMELDNTMVTRLLVFLSASSLGVRRDLIDALGLAMRTEMSAHYQVDQTFFDLIRDKQVLNAMVAEYAGTTAAKGNAKETAKTQRAVLTACMDGTRNRADPNWTPRYMAFPQGSYREEQSENEVAFDNVQREAA